jgi:hypothetical protein
LGCWDSSKTFEFTDGLSTGSGMGISGYCFDENGWFSINNTFGFNGGIENSSYKKSLILPVGSYSSASEKSQLGWYRIDEYTIQLHYDDGATETKFNCKIFSVSQASSHVPPLRPYQQALPNL